jgi:hypothetical protein
MDFTCLVHLRSAADQFFPKTQPGAPSPREIVMNLPSRAQWEGACCRNFWSAPLSLSESHVRTRGAGKLPLPPPLSGWQLAPECQSFRAPSVYVGCDQKPPFSFWYSAGTLPFAAGGRGQMAALHQLLRFFWVELAIPVNPSWTSSAITSWIVRRCRCCRLEHDQHPIACQTD